MQRCDSLHEADTDTDDPCSAFVGCASPDEAGSSGVTHVIPIVGNTSECSAWHGGDTCHATFSNIQHVQSYVKQRESIDTLLFTVCPVCEGSTPFSCMFVELYSTIGVECMCSDSTRKNKTMIHI